MTILYPEKKYCFKSATETLKLKEDNPNENIFKKQPPVMFYKKTVLKCFSQNFFFNKVV